jgi:hypothetical protein
MVLSSMLPLLGGPLAALLQATPPPAVPIGYDRPAMVYDARRGVVVHFGGGDNIRSTPGDTWEWDGATWTKRDVTGPPGRFSHAMVYDSRRGRIVLFGGGPYGSFRFTDTWEYDGTRWEQKSDSGPGPRGGFGMAYDSARGRTVLFGGATDAGRVADRDTWEWDGTRWTRIVTQGPTAAEFIRMAYDARRSRVVAFGGRGGGAETWEWDGQRWTRVATSGPPPRDHHSMTYDARRGRVVVFGGGGQPTGVGTYVSPNAWLNDLWEWDGSRWTQVAEHGPPHRVAIAGLAFDERRGRLVLYGGRANGTWEWDGTRWTQVIGGAWPAARAGHVMATGGVFGGVLLSSGQIGRERRTVDTLWQWNGVGWRALTTDGPRYRTLPAAAFDTHRDVFVVFGGAGLVNQNAYGDTWEWNGTGWSERPVDSPGPRDHHAMAYDEARGVIVMFGGQNAARAFPHDTWTYDGTAWKRVDSTTGPPSAAHHAMAYDAKRQRVVLYGGTTDRREVLHPDVWEWDGTRWHRVTPASPGPRATRHRMAYDAARAVTLLHSATETWSWDGMTWRRLATTGPSQRIVSAMAYDAQRQRVVLFGGAGPGGEPPFDSHADVWEWDGTRWIGPFRRPG